MTPESIASAVISVIGSLGGLGGILSKNRRLRSNIRDNLRLLDELQANPSIRDETPATSWLSAAVALDVARLAKVPLGNPKTPIPKGSIVWAAIIGTGFGYWAYVLDEDGFNWYSLLPGTVVAMMIISIFGMTTNREIPQEENDSVEREVPTAHGGDSVSNATEVAAEP
jgi:hypothetical protein